MTSKRDFPGCFQCGLVLAALIGASSVHATECPPAGARYVIKGFTMETPVTASGEAYVPGDGCKWRTDDHRELWWEMGDDVVAVKVARPMGTKMGGNSAAANKASANQGSGAGQAGGKALTPGSVYTCTLPGIGLFTGAYFGIVDGSTYRDFDGRTGQYTFDARSGILRLTTGSGAGLAYQRQPEGNFRVLDEADAVTGGNCVHNPRKSIDGRW